jgi:hypothetical protein
VGAFALHNQIDWEWQQTALTVLAYPIPVLIACTAVTSGALAVRAPRRGAAVFAAAAFALAIVPVTLPVLSNRGLARADHLDAQGRVDEARVEADLAAALDRTSVDAQLERASGRPRALARARRRPHVARARRLSALLLERPRLARERAAGARALGARHRLLGLRRPGGRLQRRVHGRLAG